MKTVYFKKKYPKIGVLMGLEAKIMSEFWAILMQKENVKDDVFMKNGVQEDINLFVRDNLIN